MNQRSRCQDGWTAIQMIHKDHVPRITIVTTEVSRQRVISHALNKNIFFLSVDVYHGNNRDDRDQLDQSIIF